MTKQCLILLCYILGISFQASATDSHHAFIEAITLEHRNEIKIETYGEVITYDTLFDLPVKLDAVESFAQKHQLSMTVKTYDKPKAGSGCAHSPVCVILLPFLIVDILTSQTITVVTFSDSDDLLLRAEYEPPFDLLSKLEIKPALTNPITITSSKALKRIYISHFDEIERSRVINQLYQALPQINEEEGLSTFHSDVISISEQEDPDWAINAFDTARKELEKTTRYNAKQQTALANLACKLATEYEHNQSKLPEGGLNKGDKHLLLSSSTGIQTLHASQAVLACFAAEERFSTPQLEEIKRLLQVQANDLCNDTVIPDEDWHNLMRKFFFAHSSLVPQAKLECDSQLFKIYQHSYQEHHITQSNYEYLAKTHPLKSERLRERFSISDPNVLAARLSLSTDKTYDALSVLNDIKKQEPTFTVYQSQLLARLYSINLYEIDSMPLLPDSDDDIDKQAEILLLLAGLPSETKQQLNLEPLAEPYAKAAWDIAIKHDPPANVIALLLEKEASKSNISTAKQVSDQVNQHGHPKYSDLVWLALNLVPEIGKPIIDQYQIAQQRKEANAPDWLEKSKTWLNTVEQKISTE